MKPTAIIAALFVVLATTPAAAQPLERSQPQPRLEHVDRDGMGPLIPFGRGIACPDQQTVQEMLAMRQLGDREGEAITGRSYGCGPVIRPRPGPFER